MANEAVINASPLIFLSRANRLDLLRHVADIVHVPRSVADEICNRRNEKKVSSVGQLARSRLSRPKCAGGRVPGLKDFQARPTSPQCVQDCQAVNGVKACDQYQRRRGRTKLTVMLLGPMVNQRVIVDVFVEPDGKHLFRDIRPDD